MYRNGIKRLLAVILSLCGMIVLSPLLLILCLAIKIDSPGPIFFRQKRVGSGTPSFSPRRKTAVPLTRCGGEKKSDCKKESRGMAWRFWLSPTSILPLRHVSIRI